MKREIELRLDYLNDEPVESIYFGGGTPSLLSKTELMLLLDTTFKYFNVVENAEITLEANPDDLDLTEIKMLKDTPVNRLSIGIQTFDDQRLSFINRSHTKKQALEAILRSQDAGFDNITADLIYGIPPDEMDYWKRDLEELLRLDLPHISIYGLTIEKKTVFGNWTEKGKFKEISESTSVNQYLYAIETLQKAGYEHYEVSNFARQGMQSKHNSAYWDGMKYLGIGPGAHSYNNTQRAFNISNNYLYLKAIESDKLSLTVDPLTATNHRNEYILTRIRTKKGINTDDFAQKFGRSILGDFKSQLEELCSKKLIVIDDGNLSLTTKGFLIADEISLCLFYDE